MRKFLMFLMLCICLSSVAQKPQTKGSSRQQATNKKTITTKKSQQPSKKQQLQDQQKKLKKDIAANKKQKANLELKVKQQLEDVFILGTEIDEQKRVIDTLRVGLDSIDRQITDLNGQLETLQSELRERQKRYASSVRYMHRSRSMQSRMKFILSAKNINQVYRRTRFMNEYSTYQRAQGEAVRQKQAQVTQKRQEVEQAKAEQAQLLARQEQEQQTLVRQQNQKQRMADELQKQQRTVSALIDQQQKEEAAINAQIDRIIAEEIAREQARLEAERKRREEQARLERERLAREQKAREEKARERELAKAQKKEQKQEKKQNKAIDREVRRETRDVAREERSTTPKPDRYLAADPDARLTGSFASNKGRLPMPITGAYQMVRGYGDNVVDDTRGVHLSSKGIYLKGKDGAQARCVFDGVVSRIFNTGSSYVVMVRHGRFISVYSDLASVSVAAGQKVSTSQTLGRLGPTNIMQFQLRNWTELLNPRNWLRR